MEVAPPGFASGFAPHSARTGPRRRVWRVARRVLGTLGALLLLLVLSAQVSPWPSALVIRTFLDRAGSASNAALAPRVPAHVTGIADASYDDADPDARFELFHPDDLTSGQTRPTIVWVHGGAFVAGGKAQVANYLRILAGRGFTVVGLDYSLAPGSTYPQPVRQVGHALAHLVGNATDLHVDPHHIVLAGDSSGAHIAAQVAALATDPAYAGELGIDPPTPAPTIVGTVLLGGPYDLALAQSTPGLSRWLVDTGLWSYTGSYDYADDPRFASASVAQRLTATFPPTFVSAGNADPLLPHSRALAAELDRLGVVHEAYFFPDDLSPGLGNEFQFDLDRAEARDVLEHLVAFVDRVTRPTS